VSHARLLIDTNVVLDLLLARSPFDQAAVEITAAIARGEFSACLCATTVTTIHYLARKHLGSKAALTAIGRLLDVFDVAPVTEFVLRAALTRNFSDFEDAVIDAAAEQAGVTGIVTRDSTGFAKSQLPVFSPDELLQVLASR
jgi:predicted nucleic acid-binding protein